MIQGVLNLPDQVARTTFHAITASVTVGDAVPDFPLESASLVFRKDGEETLEIPVTINIASSWDITIGPVAAEDMDMETGIHTYDLLTVDSAGNKEKYVGGTMKILYSPQ